MINPKQVILRPDPTLLSYQSLRRTIGMLAFIFPLVLLLGGIVLSDCSWTQNSISHYYHTVMRNGFVGILCAVGLFLFSYRGYDIRDTVAGVAACIMVIGVAFFPTGIKENIPGCNLTPTFSYSIFGTIHLICAILFFLLLSYFSLVLFTKSEHTIENRKNWVTFLFYSDIFNPSVTRKLSKAKRNKNRVFLICGIAMLVCLLLIAIYMLFLENKYPQIDGIDPVFWLETLALWAFGVSWMTKGEMIF